jgi:DNA-binding CsgD family transcriptional regulator
MSALAMQAPLATRLRVRLYATDPERSVALRAIILQAGHTIAEAHEQADIALCDADCAPNESLPYVTLGGPEGDHAGWLARDADAAQIDAALRAAAAGLIVRSPQAGGFASIEEAGLEALLTPRELEVLNAIAEGLTNKLIARRLDISLHTVKFHVESLFRKLGVRTRTEALAKAAERRRRETIEL